MRRTLLTALGISALLLAGCTPSATVNLNTNLNADDDNEVNANVNAGRNDANDRIPPAVIFPPDGGPPGNLRSEDASIEAELNAVGPADLDAEIGDIENELNAE